MFLIFHGEDAFSQDEAVAALKRALGDQASIDLNVAVFDGRAALSVSDLRAACDAMPFLADRRVVIVEGLLTRLLAREEDDAEGPAAAKGRGKGLLDQLAAYLPALPVTTELVFLERRELPARHALLKLADGEIGTARLFGPPRLEDVPGWIVQRARRHAGAVTPQAAQLLAQYVGADLRALDQELEKLITYAGAARPVGPEDVQALVPAAGQANVFGMVDALGRRDARQATQLLHQLLALGEHPLGLLAMIVRQFRLLLQAKELSDGGVRPADLAHQLGLPGFVADKLARQARQFTMARLESTYRQLLDIDLAIKGGEVEAETALDMFVAGLA
jgi:DNA polymerase-3 subunit delta